MGELRVVGVTDSRGSLHGRDHLSADDAATTLCGLRQRSEDGGRSDIIPLGRNQPAPWEGAFRCHRCEATRRILARASAPTSEGNG